MQLIATADILAKKHGVNVAFLNQSGLLSRPYSWMTPHSQYGDTLCFSCVVYFTLGSLATAAIHWLEFSPFVRFQKGCVG